MSILTLATTSGGIEPWQGLTAIGVLAGVVAFLFRIIYNRMTAADAALVKEQAERADEAKKHAEELGRRDVREVTLRAEYESKLALQAKEYASALRQDRIECREREDQIRSEFAAVVELVGDRALASAKEVTAALNRLYDSSTGAIRPRR